MNNIEQSIQFPEDVLFQEVAGETVLLNLTSGKYYGLDEVGTRMWQLLHEHGCLEPVVTALLDEYDIDETTLRHDLERLVHELAEQGLLSISQEAD